MFRLLSVSYLFAFLLALSPFVIGTSYAEPSAEESTGTTSGQKVETELAANEAGKININTASASELQTLKGVGKKRAQQIVEDRQANGPFQSPQDLTRIKGIGPKTVAKNLDIITVGNKQNKDTKDTDTQK